MENSRKKLSELILIGIGTLYFTVGLRIFNRNKKIQR